MAIAEGAEMIEMDVRPTQDGVPVLCHDPTLNIGDGRSVRISETRLEVLRQLPNGDDIHLPALEPVLKALGRKAAYNLEIKETGVEDAVLALVHGFGLTRQAMITSFDGEILENITRRDPCVPLGQIHEAPMEDPNTLAAWYLGRKAVRRANANGHPFVVLDRRLVTPRVLSLAKSLELRCLIWTVNDPLEAKRLASLGVFGLITDHPALLSQLFPSEIPILESARAAH
jgi:glycerophosphoryl diester phosphodiesterase